MAIKYDLRTLLEAYHQLNRLNPKELFDDTYVGLVDCGDNFPVGRMCAVGAFNVGLRFGPGAMTREDIARKADKTREFASFNRHYLIEAKHYDPTTVDELEAVNQGFIGSPANRYLAVMVWLARQIKWTVRCYGNR